MVCVRCGKNYLQGITAQLVWKLNIVVGNCGLWIAQVVVVVSRFDMQSNYMDTTYLYRFRIAETERRSSCWLKQPLILYSWLTPAPPPTVKSNQTDRVLATRQLMI